MKSEWRVTSNFINGKKMYAAYRLKDINAVDHSGNREYSGGYVKDRETSAIVAEELNEIRTCRVCGCTDDFACPGGCWWVEEDLCSECVRKELNKKEEENK